MERSRSLRVGYLAALLLAILATACSSAPVESSAPTQEVPEPTTTVASTTTTVASTTTVPATTAAPTTTTAAPTTTTTTSTTTTTVPEAPEFSSTIQEIDADIAARMTHSWREGCPVGFDQLRLLTLSHWDFDDQSRTGELVVHADWADEIVRVFGALYDAQFPIERMELIDVYEGDDLRSIAANNTSGFNCREVLNRPGVWSNHAIGTAIDINPVQNPYLSRQGEVLPVAGAEFLDRTVEAKGGIYSGDAVTTAFGAIGWGWGGDWASSKDWQHFSASGT